MKRVVVFLKLLLLCCSLSCDSSDGVPQAKFRAVNVSPDSDAIDVYLDGDVHFDRVRYSEATSYDKLDEGSHELKITLNDSFTTFFDSRKNLAEDAEYTLFFFDFAENGTGELVRDNNNRPDSGLVKLRFVHAAPSLDEIDLYITDRNESIELATPTFEAVRFSEIPDYVESIDGVYQIRATRRNSKTVVADSGALDLEGGRILTILLVDSEGGGAPFQVVVLVDS